MVESNKCKYVEREPVYGACTVAKCDEGNQMTHTNTIKRTNHLWWWQFMNIFMNTIIFLFLGLENLCSNKICAI